MTDIENNVFTAVTAALTAEFPDISVYGDEVSAPSSFPCATIVETDDYTVSKMQTATARESYSHKVYTANAYSNLAVGRKTQCKAIMNVIDQVMQDLYFEKTMNQPMSNADQSIARRIARWRGVADSTGRIYRR